MPSGRGIKAFKLCKYVKTPYTTYEINNRDKQDPYSPEKPEEKYNRKLFCVQWMSQINFHTGYNPQCCDSCRLAQKNIPCFGK